MADLDRMFELQRDLQRRLGTELIGDQLRQRGFIAGGTRALVGLTTIEQREMMRWHKEFSLALMMEASELMDWSPWKHWSKQLGNKSGVAPFTEEHVKEVALEIVDCFHFLINIALLYGLSASDVAEIFENKNAVNHQRQEGGSY